MRLGGCCCIDPCVDPCIDPGTEFISSAYNALFSVCKCLFYRIVYWMLCAAKHCDWWSIVVMVWCPLCRSRLSFNGCFVGCCCVDYSTRILGGSNYLPASASMCHFEEVRCCPCLGECLKHIRRVGIWGGAAVRGRSCHGGCRLSKVGYINSCRIKYQAIWLLKVEYFPKL